MTIRTRPYDNKDTSLFDGIHMYLENNTIAIPKKFCREVWKVLRRSLESSAEKFHRLDLGVWK
jgi:hypothetical protein